MGAVPPRRRAARPVFLDDSRQSAEGLIGLPRTRKRGRYIRLKHHHHTARGVTRRIFVGLSTTEVVLGKNVIDTDPTRFSTFTFRPVHIHRLLYLHALRTVRCQPAGVPGLAKR
jgi:hypothetical protein